MTTTPSSLAELRRSEHAHKRARRGAGQKMDRALEETIARERRRASRIRLLIELLLTAFIIFQLFGALLGIARVEGDSMAPTLQKGDFAVYYRLGRTYLRGDIVLFKQEDLLYVKRVVAVAGDIVDLNEDVGILTVNGEEEHYGIDATVARENGTAFPLNVQEGYVFLLGDNRAVSMDSREGSIGAVQTKEIRGRLIYLFRIVQRSGS